MPKTKAHMRSSRRIPSLRDNEIDHEIGLVDRSAPVEDPRPLTPDTGDTGNDISHSPSNQPLIPSESLTSSMQPTVTESEEAEPSGDMANGGPSGGLDTNRASTRDPRAGKEPVSKRDGVVGHSNGNKRRSHASKEQETAIDILYENQRGGFLCGIPLFSSAALGNLDPAPWTNFAHKASMTDTQTAQVPDPSWEWAWPEWRVNHDESIQADGDGWEYSFMFAKSFSWHGPKWYNSFVRRRTWIRRRIKKGLGYQANDPHMSVDYFSVTASRKDAEGASIAQQGTRPSQETPRMSRDSRRGGEDEAEAKARADITTVSELMAALRRSRIDREKLDAVENYTKKCTDDLQDLQHHMHEIMAMFMFQASRKLLLARLIQLHDNEADQKRKGKAPASPKKTENLAEAIKHADEEVRRLEYWSDIKGMAESGKSRGAVDCEMGWDGAWEGLDNSGPMGVKADHELPYKSP
ncbi:hypothetical protein GGR54DRAFT_594443 [Hypoxylon sp. NC1633]|nr:hypothetical protein GGR54DRAFT_594443 [Hypoxylon sp. NC1633]